MIGASAAVALNGSQLAMQNSGTAPLGQEIVLAIWVIWDIILIGMLVFTLISEIRERREEDHR